MGTVSTIVNAVTGETVIEDTRTPEEVQADKRKIATLDVADLIAKMVQANIITQAEAVAWVKDGTVPSSVVSAISALPTLKEKVQAFAEAKRNSTYSRDSVFIAAVQSAAGVSDTAVDNLFGIV